MAEREGEAGVESRLVDRVWRADKAAGQERRKLELVHKERAPEVRFTVKADTASGQTEERELSVGKG